jgi:VIT1/CCC1 family predicted Fe2+/Mn2+ transporter
VPVENPARVVYGIIAVGALMAAESGRNESYPDTVASALLATALYWLAHSYAEVLGQRLATSERLTARAMRDAAVHEFAVVRGATIPLLALLISWAAGASQQTAVTAALWSSVASLFVFELIAGMRSRASPREIALETAVGAVLALGIVFLKSLLH